MATVRNSILWFKQQFAVEIENAIVNTPISLDLLAAIAMQETGFIWGTLASKGLLRDEILALCTGDTLDAPKRSAFPADKKALLEADQGQQMFDIARGALESVASRIAAYAMVAENQDKFCHGFGIFQLDLQFYLKKDRKAFFLERRWYSFSNCLRLCLGELCAALDRVYPGRRGPLTDEEMVYVAIAYNCGHVDLSKGFKQGYKSRDGLYYGESVCNYLQIAHEVC